MASRRRRVRHHWRPIIPGWCGHPWMARGSPTRFVGVQIVEQALHGGAHPVEGLLADNGRPLRFDRGHTVAGMGHDSTSAVGQADELGAAVPRVWLPLQVTELLKVVHEL